MSGHQQMQVRIPGVFTRLIELGQAAGQDELRVQELLPTVVSGESINRFLPSAHFLTAKQMTKWELELLIRGLVTAESRLRWLGGSAATGIRLFRIFEEQEPGRAELLGDWILKHEYNPYLPCGWIREGTSTMEQYRLIPVWREARRRRHEEDCQRRHLESLRRRHARKDRGETRVTAQKAASAMRKGLLERLSPLSAQEKLRYVVTDTENVPQYYPEHLASLSLEQVRSLDPVLREQLIDRLATIRRGAWRNLQRSLREARSTG